MGFKYLLVPASPNDEIKELEYAEDVLDLTNDTFRSHIEQHFRFATGSGEIDKSVLMEQLKTRTGVDLKGDEAPHWDALLNATSVEIFPVMMPTKDTMFNAISVYCDDKGVAKNLEDNHRMTSLIQACGYPGQSFRGDCFIGRVFDDTEDEWRRIDFTLADLSADANWVQQVKKQRSNKSSGDMKSMADKIGMNNPAHVNANAVQDNQVPTGETDQYTWKQGEDEVELTFKKEGLQKGDKKDVKVTFGRQKLKVVVKGESLFDGELFASTNADEATWTLSDGVLQVTMCKSENATWSGLLKE